MVNQKNWQRLWQKLGGQTDPSPIFEALATHYSQPHRAYHNLDHIADCLQQFEAVRQQASQADAVELALWLHDVIYDTQARDNEAQSAAWATQVMQAGGMTANNIKGVNTLILATQHTAIPQQADAKLLVDIDLSILGRAEVEFAAYEAKIRQEYHWVPQTAFCQGRMAILESFLARETIYQTPYFQAQYETSARANLQQSIRQLRRLLDHQG